ncbi:cobalt transporter [Plantibacter flavus]|uniref:energy-coupling factor transporter transmembrane component T n=1 Tax=Plantibacter TaxID=190323 RepID=UPI0010C1F7C2|nr:MULTISPECIES: energy-coupling factor transporter transmembrane component T [Plantibacter]MBD8103814.1 energy-coupling factor transporter transmembrane protein EcfT [Plantibacter sp. CFBP 8775]MBD8467262.1 energy-coupling factor transporter transmembrane protein EcfT [Plantibacter sp. CFBP 8798]TKJ96739.1 cobalt transporter [Plantibacter flavus]
MTRVDTDSARRTEKHAVDVDITDPQPPRGLDPRTAILLLVATSIAVMQVDGARWMPAAFAVGLTLTVWERAWRRALTLLVTVGVLAALESWLPIVWPNAVTTTAGVGASYLLRFVLVAAIGAHLIATTTPTRLSASLRAWRVPRPIAVTLGVMVRFFPVVANEAHAVLEAMRLRGLVNARGVARHPLRAAEQFVVPMIAASLRASDDLSAAAILRGLGSHRTPVPLVPPRFGLGDLLVVLFAAALATTTLLLRAVT